MNPAKTGFSHVFVFKTDFLHLKGRSSPLGSFVILGKFIVARCTHKKSFFLPAKNSAPGKICRHLSPPPPSHFPMLFLFCFTKPRLSKKPSAFWTNYRFWGMFSCQNAAKTRFLRKPVHNACALWTGAGFSRGQFSVGTKTAGCGNITLVQKNKSAKVSSGKTHRAGGFRRALFFIKNAPFKRERPKIIPCE